jgi:hypothetical protein
MATPDERDAERKVDHPFGDREYATADAFHALALEAIMNAWLCNTPIREIALARLRGRAKSKVYQWSNSLR